MQDEDRQTQEAFDATTGQAMALTPPRVEDQALVPRSEAGQGVEPLEFARPSFESAVERFMSAGQTDINPDDPALFNAYRRSMDYLGDMALGGLDLTDAAFQAAVGIVAQALPEDQERRFARDMVSMPDAFLGYSPGRIQSAVDRVAEGVAQVGRNLQQPGPMPTLGSNLGNVASGSPSPRRGPANVPRFIVPGENTTLPNPTFGNMKLRDIFEEDQWENRLDLDFTPEEEGVVGEMPLFVNPDNGDTFGTGPNFNLGYAPNIRVHDLADIVLGRRTVEDTLNYFGEDPDPDLVDYINTRISNLQERPEFQEYVERYGSLNEPYDPYEFLQNNRSPLLQSLIRRDNPFDARGDTTVATFRSPIPDILGQITFPRDGIKGSQLLKELQDSPSVRGSELRSLGVNIDPQKRYSEEEARNLFEGRLWTATASLLEFPRFADYQRQKVLDPVIDYFELTVNANRSDAPNFMSSRPQHFNEDTLSHTRASVLEDSRGQYILPEEFQSDLLQRGFVTSSTNLRADISEILTTKLSYSPDEDWVDYIADSNFTETFGRVINGLARERDFDGGEDEYVAILDALQQTLEPRKYRDFVVSAARAAGENTPLPNLRDYLVPKNYAEPPIQKTVEGVRLAFDGLLAEAQNRGINRIVIPPFERIVARRFGEGTEDYKNALKPTSGFYATYVKGVNQVLKEYEAEFGSENFSIRPMDINYEPTRKIDLTEGVRVPSFLQGFLPQEPVELPVTGIEINFQGALDAGYDFSSPRFAEGGLVQNYNSGGVVSMEEQMSLFDMGGLTDDGAMRDPVSGNEVPPGSMATEVRDDVPAMLSEGEYIVPADVVRYYGVKFFEDLRGQAKSGLMDMERNGRIGGEPVDAPMAEGDLTPEEMAMLSQITGMYAGGDVRRPTEKMMSVGEALANMSIYEAINSPGIIWTPSGHQATTPEMKRELFRSMGLIQIAEESGDQTTRAFQVGGVVAPTMTTEDFTNEATQAGGFRLPTSVFTPTPPTTPTAPVFTPVTLYGPTGDTMLASTKEQYDQLIAQGYTTTPRVTPVVSDGGGGGGGSDDLEAAGGGFKLSDENLEALLNDPFKFGTDALGKEPMFSSRQMAGAGSMIGGMPGMLAGGLAGAAMELDNIAKAQAALRVAEARKLTGTPEYEALKSSVDTAIENLSGPAKLLERLGLGSGNSYFNQANEAGITPTVAPVTPRVTTPTSGGTTTPSDAGLSRAQSMTEAEKAAGRAYADTGSDRETSWSGGQVAEKQTAPSRDMSAADKRASAERAAERQGTGMATKGRATGGLVARPSRKKPVA